MPKVVGLHRQESLRPEGGISLTGVPRLGVPRLGVPRLGVPRPGLPRQGVVILYIIILVMILNHVKTSYSKHQKLALMD